MTDTEAKRREAICEIANIKDIGAFPDMTPTPEPEEVSEDA